MDIKMRIENKGQVAIWIIVAIVIVAMIVLLFLVSRGGPTILRAEEFNPENYIDQCIRNVVREKVDIILPQGGFVNPSNYHLYKDAKVTYVCQNINHFEPCINQYPAFKEQIEREIEREVDNDIDVCFDSLQIELEKRNYEYTSGQHEIEVNLRPEIAEIIVTKEFTYGKGDSEISFERFKSNVQTPIGKLSDVVGNFIVYEESQRCYAENSGWLLLYGNQRGIDIKKDTSYDSTRVYTLIDKKTGKEMNVAIRGCVIAHGFYGL